MMVFSHFTKQVYVGIFSNIASIVLSTKAVFVKSTFKKRVDRDISI